MLPPGFPFPKKEKGMGEGISTTGELSETHLLGTIVQCKAEAPNHFFPPQICLQRFFITTPPKSNLLGSLFLELAGFLEKTGSFGFYTKVMAIL